MTDTPTNVVRMRDRQENVVETLERLVKLMLKEDHSGENSHELGILITMTRSGRMEVCRLGSGTNRCAILGALDIAKDIMLNEVMEGYEE